MSASQDNLLQLLQSDVIVMETSSALKQVLPFDQRYVYTHDFCVIFCMSESRRKVKLASMAGKLFVGKSILPNCWWELILFLVDGILLH